LLNEDFLKIEEVKEAMARLKYISADKRIRAEADLRLRGLNDRNSEITVATEKGIAIGEEKGKAEGIAIGKQEGKAEGIAIGEEKGKAEGIAIGKEEGKAEGIAIGEEKGKAEGIAIGEEKGKAEGIAIGKQESAIKMLKKSISLEDISEITGLSIKEIKSLKK
jgi:predicted transposase YdaD